MTDLRNDPAELNADLNAGLDADLRELLARPVPAPTGQVLLRSRQQLAGHAGPAHPRRTVIAAAASVAVVAAGVVVAPRLLGGPAQPGSQAASGAAARFLDELADTVDASGPGDGSWQQAPYWYTASVIVNGADQPVGQARRIWIGHDRPGLLEQDGRRDSLPGSTFGAVGKAARPVGWDGLWSLPTDPERLATLLRQGFGDAGNGPDAELYVVVFDLLRESPAPPKLRAALYRVVAAIPGVRLVGPVTDARQRAGVAIERDNGGTAERHVFDPDDGRILEESSGPFTATYVAAKPAQSLPSGSTPAG